MTKTPEELIADLDRSIQEDDDKAGKQAALGIMAQILRDLNRLANATVIIAHHLSKDK